MLKVQYLDGWIEDHSIHLHCDEGLSHLLDKIHREKGWDFRHYKKGTIKRRIHIRLNAANALTYKDYSSVLDSDGNEYDRLLSALTIKVSHFFREPEVFHLLKEAISSSALPEEGLRAWSCGCAHGEEAYSLGILLDETLGTKKAESARIFATDIDPIALDAARKGVFREDSMQNVASNLRKTYFSSAKTGYRLTPRIRHMVRFGYLDIVKGTPLSRIDILFCRNLLIYFEKTLQEKVLEKLDFALRPGGILVLGKDEALPHPFLSRYAGIEEQGRVYRKRS